MSNWYDRLLEPMVPKGWVTPIQDYIDDPTQEDRGVVRPFMAGALEGLRNLTTPIDFATAVLPPVLGAARLGAVIPAIGRLGRTGVGPRVDRGSDAIQGLSRGLPGPDPGDLPWEELLGQIQARPVRPPVTAADDFLSKFPEPDASGFPKYEIPDNPAARELEGLRAPIERRMRQQPFQGQDRRAPQLVTRP